MNKIFAIILINFFTLSAIAQHKPVVKYDQPYGVIDTADLTMKQCDFEKDAHAEVLFDVQKVTCNNNSITNEQHLRVKIFDDEGKSFGTIKINLRTGGMATDNVKNIQAETVNLNGKTIERVQVDKTGIYTQKNDENSNTMFIPMPAVRAGSVIDVSYTWITFDPGHFPQWIPQSKIPSRYCQLIYHVKTDLLKRIKMHITQPFVNDTVTIKNDAWDVTHTWALANIHSFKPEPFMGFKEDNMQHIDFLRYKPNTPADVRLDIYNRFTKETSSRIMPDSIVKAIKDLGTDARIAYIFNYVKNNISWDKEDGMRIPVGIRNAWIAKAGNSTEVNLALCSMLKQGGIKCWPMVLATHDYYKLDLSDLFIPSFNRTVVFVPVDDEHNYILDATSKYNNYQQTPADLLDLNGVLIDDNENAPLHVVSTIDNRPAVETTFIDAQIDTSGKITGNATLTDYGYFKNMNAKLYYGLGDASYKRVLTNGNNNIKISSIKFEDAAIDTLPLIQNIDFNLDADGADDGYIYFKPNLFSSLQTNPFTDETRLSDIHFGYRRFYNITGDYKLPAGYKIETLPKNTTMLMPDSSIVFKRFIGVQDDGAIQVRYSLHFNKSLFLRSDYAALYEFYRKMFEALNEQIVLKKS